MPAAPRPAVTLPSFRGPSRGPLCPEPPFGGPAGFFPGLEKKRYVLSRHVLSLRYVLVLSFRVAIRDSSRRGARRGGRFRQPSPGSPRPGAGPRPPPPPAMVLTPLKPCCAVYCEPCEPYEPCSHSAAGSLPRRGGSLPLSPRGARRDGRPPRRAGCGPPRTSAQPPRLPPGPRGYPSPPGTDHPAGMKVNATEETCRRCATRKTLAILQPTLRVKTGRRDSVTETFLRRYPAIFGPLAERPSLRG